jgi:PST family polysaccharide transporter
MLLLWRGFLRSAAGAGGAVLARAVGSLTVNKLVALYGGPGGLTLLAQFQNLMALLTTLPNDGVHVGLVKYLAPLRPGSARHRAWLGAALLLSTVTVGAGLLVLAAFQSWGGTAFKWESGSGLAYGLLFGLGILFLTLQTLLGQALLAAGRLRGYVILAVLISALGTGAAALVLHRQAAISRVLLSYLLAQGLTVVPAMVLAARAGLLPLGHWWRGRPSRSALRALRSFVLMAASVLLFGKAVDFGVRALLMQRYGLAETDLWQAVAKLSDNYTMVVSAVLSSVFYPRLAALVGQAPAARAYVAAVLRLLGLGLAAGLGLIFALRDWLLPLLFAPRLLAARVLLGPQLLGDWAKFLTWILLFQLLAQARLGRYVAAQAISAVIYVALLVVLLPAWGLPGVVWAHTARYGLLLAGYLWLHARGQPTA